MPFKRKHIWDGFVAYWPTGFKSSHAGLGLGSLNHSINPLHLHFTFFVTNPFHKHYVVLCSKQKSMEISSLACIFWAPAVDRASNCIWWEIQRLALNWRKRAYIEIGKYYHLLEGNYSGRSTRWVSKIKAKFNSKNKHLSCFCYQKTVLG